jgi:hypothetical protein
LRARLTAAPLHVTTPPRAHTAARRFASRKLRNPESPTKARKSHTPPPYELNNSTTAFYMWVVNATRARSWLYRIPSIPGASSFTEYDAGTAAATRHRRRRGHWQSARAWMGANAAAAAAAAQTSCSRLKREARLSVAPHIRARRKLLDASEDEVEIKHCKPEITMRRMT